MGKKRHIRWAGHVLRSLSVIALAAASGAQQSRVPQSAQLTREQAAEVPRYLIEIIVFENLEGTMSGSEIFTPDPPVEPQPFSGSDAFGPDPDMTPSFSDRPEEREPAGAAPIDQPATDEAELSFSETSLEEIPTYEMAGFKILDPSGHSLDDAYRRIERLDAYRPLMRAAWIQPTLEQARSEPLKLRRIGDPPLRLNGTVNVYLSRFLHVVVDLALEDPVPYRSGAEPRRVPEFGDRRTGAGFGFGSRYGPQPVFYRIQEDRILRSGETRYYDHPKFGVLAKVTRIEEPETDPLDSTRDLLPGNP